MDEYKIQTKMIAMFIISLVLAMPIYSSGAYAAIRAVSAKGGTDNIEGYLQNEDWIWFNVDVIISGDADITPEQVKLSPSGKSFDSCTGPQVDGTFRCSLRFPSADKWYFTGESPYTVILYKDDGTQDSKRSGTIIVDEKNPVFSSFLISPKNAGAQDITFSYSVKDYAAGTSTDKCSGIKNIQFYDFSGSFVKIIDVDISDCVKSGTVVVPSTTFSEGGHTIYAKVLDRFNKESEPLSDSFTIDKTPPTIDSASFELTYLNGEPLSYLGSNPVKAEASVKIFGSDLNINKIVGDFSAYNAKVSSYKSLNPSGCVQIEGGNKCKWTLDISITETGTKYAKINASDYSGNTGSASVSHSFMFDDSAPIVTEIKTDKVYGGVSYASMSGNNFVALISDPGAGISAQDILLHVYDKSFVADRCEAGMCYWSNIGISKQDTVSAWIGEDSKDRLGNKVVQFVSSVVVDATKPVLQSLDITPVGGALPAYNYIKTQDSLEITAVLSDNTFIAEAYADLSSFITGANKVLADDCTQSGDKYECTWTTQPIDVAGYIDDPVKFTFIDAGGNVLLKSVPLEVYELTDSTLDYWRHTVECSPRLIDRQTTVFVNHRVYCDVKLTSGSAETVAINLNGCDGPMEYLEIAPEITNNVPGSRDPYITFTLSAEEMSVSELNYTCNINIVSKLNNKITRYPEIEEVSIPIQFYNMPLGSYDQTIDDKIEEAKDFAWYIDDWVEEGNKIVQYGEAACSTVNALIKLFGGLSIIGEALTIASASSGPAGPEIDKLREKIQEVQQGVGGNTKDAWAKKFNKFCKFFSCRLYYDDAFDGPTAEKIGAWQRKVFEGADYVATAGGKVEGLEAWSNKEDKSNEVNIFTGKLNPKDSIIISTLTMCLPGIVYNLNKLRQIQCMYVDCMQNYATYGLPLSACEDQKNYATCKYWWGEVFQLLPFTGLWNSMIGLVKQAFSSPLGFIDVGLAYVCTYKIKTPMGGGPAALCMINDLAGLVADVASDLEGLGEKWEIQEDYCENID